MVTNNADNYQPVQYNVLTGGASGGINNISTSTTGQVLTSQGASAQPIWGGGASMVLLFTQTVSNAVSVTFNSSLITSTYKVYCLLITGAFPANNGDAFDLDLSTNSGSSYLSANYLSGIQVVAYNGGGFGNVNSAATTVLVHNTSNTAESSTSFNGVFYLTNFNNGNYPEVYGTVVQASSGGSLYFQLQESVQQSTTAINAIRITAATGNIAAGNFSLYGIVQ
jgi:hypothetical protein